MQRRDVIMALGAAGVALAGAGASRPVAAQSCPDEGYIRHATIEYVPPDWHHYPGLFFNPRYPWSNVRGIEYEAKIGDIPPASTGGQYLIPCHAKTWDPSLSFDNPTGNALAISFQTFGPDNVQVIPAYFRYHGDPDSPEFVNESYRVDKHEWLTCRIYFDQGHIVAEAETRQGMQTLARIDFWEADDLPKQGDVKKVPQFALFDFMTELNVDCEPATVDGIDQDSGTRTNVKRAKIGDTWMSVSPSVLQKKREDQPDSTGPVRLDQLDTYSLRHWSHTP